MSRNSSQKSFRIAGIAAMTILIAVFSSCSDMNTDTLSEPVMTRIYAPGDYGSVAYRIPAVLSLEDGTILLVNDKRKNNESDLPQDIDIVSRYSKDMGKTWSEPVTIVEGQGYGKGFGDPVLVQAQNGDVICGFVGGQGLWKSTAKDPISSYICISHDGGQSWGEKQDITGIIWGESATATVRTKGRAAFFGSGNGLRLKSGPHEGRIMFVSSVRRNASYILDEYAVYSDDNGISWNVSDLAFEEGDESKVVQLQDGSILMSVRQTGKRGHAVSYDSGETWTEQGWWEDIKTNACNGDIISVKTKDGEVLLQSIPDSMERENVSIYISFDGGKSWPQKKLICEGPSVYSSMTVLKNGDIGMYLEKTVDKKTELWFYQLPMKWILE